ncbi:MAG: hypothetical protein IJ837_00785 [Clostridia bacterium]|nr:hypothetical protein [Clostridia bacterium]
MADENGLISRIGSSISGIFSGSPKKDDGNKGEDEQAEPQQNKDQQDEQDEPQQNKDQQEDNSKNAEEGKGKQGEGGYTTKSPVKEGRYDEGYTNGRKRKKEKNGGLFKNRFSKKERQKRKAAKRAKKNLVPGPFKKMANYAAARDAPGNPVQRSKMKYDETRKSMQKKAKKAQSSENPTEVDRLARDVNKEFKQQKKNALRLMMETSKAIQKRITEGPVGCIKDLKGCLFSTVKVVCLTILGGASIVGIILKLCGVF